MQYVLLTAGLDSIRELISHVARTMPVSEVHQHKVHSVVYALCIIHCSKNAGIQKSNIRALLVQWAKCGTQEDQARKKLQLISAGITESQLLYMEQNADHVTYVGLCRDQHLLTNYEVVSNNMCEGNNSRIKSNGQRSMAPVDHILNFLRDMASLFTTRHAIALSYQSIHRAAVCPDVTAKTFYGADLLHKQRWTVQVKHAVTVTGLSGSASTITYIVSKSDCVSPKLYELTLTYDPSKQWHQNILCPCNRTIQYGRPCYHASLCLVYPSISDANAFVSDATKFHYKIRNWYSPHFYVETMIMQYAGIVKIPTFEALTMMRLFPTRIMLLAGNA